jgi:predicted phage terminase large subunit-like protein
VATATEPRPTLAPVTADDLIAERCRRGLLRYIEEAWPLVEPTTPFKRGWHIEVICDHLEAVSAGELKRLIINIPPGHMKSLACSVFWPTWDWLTRPSRRWVFASYAESLSKRDSVKCRNIIQSAGGAEEGTLLQRLGYYGLLGLLPSTPDWRLTSDQNEKLKYENDQTGYRLATSVGGTATGEGAEILVVDDPHKAHDVSSDTKRANVLDWLDGTISTRLRPPEVAAMVLVMQRLHEQDATGHLIEQEGFEHLCLPAEYEPSHPFVWPDDPRTEPGELLFPDEYDQKAIDELKTRLGSYRAAGQLQQRPSPAEGGILKRHYWRYFPREWLDPDEWPESAPPFERMWQSWDTSLKEKTTSDYCVGQLWASDGADRYLLRQVRGQWGLPETIEQVRQLTDWAERRFPGHRSHQKRIENKANGTEVIAALKGAIQGIVPGNPSTDKVARAEAITPQLEAGNVKVPGGPNADNSGPDDDRCPAWVHELVDEAAAFPNGSNDDQVDALSQALDPTFTVRKRRKARAGKYDTSRTGAR